MDTFYARPTYRLGWLLLLAGLSFTLSAQDEFEITRAFPPARLSGEASPLSLAWAGGLNAPQLSAADLDGDGTDELYIFDRKGEEHLAFQRQADGSFTFRPDLVEHFPEKIPHWVLLRDFDDDGNMDLFAHSDTLVSGVMVFKGKRLSDGRLGFDRLTFGDQLPILYFPLANGSRTQIFVSTIDYPAIDDVDCDGDLDILTFNVGGGFVEFFQNQSIERGFGRDSLIFELVDNCYGGIFESGLSPEVTLASSPDDCATPLQNPDEPVASVRHAGSTLLTMDINQDGVKELALGDVSFSEIVMLFNGGDCEDAWFNSQEVNYPTSDVPVDIIFFPASFYLDINQDGIRDFVAAPNQLNNAEDINVLWYYRNDGQDDLPQPILQDSQFLVRDMLDLGTGAIPTAFDVDADGRLDLVVGNYNDFNRDFTVVESSIKVFRNVGSNSEPAFTLTENDYLGMSQFIGTTTEFAPSFGDLDGDGVDDALIGGRDGKLFYFNNTASAGAPPSFSNHIYPFADIDVGQNARPRIIDLDRDGLNDLVIGSRDGRIHYYRNIGSIGSPQFNPDPDAGDNLIQLGGIDTRNPPSSIGYATPFLVDQGDDFLLFTGTRKGQIELYTEIEGNIYNPFTTVTERLGQLDPGFRSEISLADFDGDERLELIVGNERGGLEYFNTNIGTN
ncbi:MAG: VCBS repeat-containing protein, partial [Bacteroidota bacterium]